MMEQAPYMELDDQVRQTASAQANSPLAGTRIDRANKTLHVYWAGAVPADLTKIQESGVRRGITVKIVPAAFSEHTLRAAATGLTKVAESTRAELSITSHHDGSGMTVRQDGLREAAQGRTAPTQVQSQILDAVNAIRGRLNIPVTLTDQGPLRYAPSTREDDRQPHWGGALTGSGCPDGFSMYATGSPSTRFMMTVAHCWDWSDGVTVTNGVGFRMGTTDFIHELFDVGSHHYDLGVIRLDPGDPAVEDNVGMVYLTNNTDGGMPVRGLARGIPRGGNYCVSTHQNVHCRLISEDAHVVCGADWIPFGRCVDYVGWFSSTGTQDMCLGDSGGPIYYWTSTGIIAAGLQATIRLAPGDRCGGSGGWSVVATAVNEIPGLAVRLA